MQKIHKTEGIIGLYRVISNLNVGFWSYIAVFWTYKCSIFYVLLRLKIEDCQRFQITYSLLKYHMLDGSKRFLWLDHYPFINGQTEDADSAG